MATNQLYADADQITLPVASGVESGDPVIVGGLVGVALTDRDADGNATVALKGAYNVTVSGAVASVGLPVYITTAGALTATAGTNALFGHALATKGAGDGVIPVRLAGQSTTPLAAS